MDKAKGTKKIRSKRSIFAMHAILLAVVAVGFEVCFYFIRKQGISEAERIGLMSTSHVATLVDDEFHFVNTSINLMLEGMIVEPDLKDIEKTRADTLFKTRRKFLYNLTEDKLYTNLEYLLAKNRLCNAAAFIFEKGTVRGTEESGVAIKVVKDGYVRQNMIESFDVFNSRLYSMAYEQKVSFYRIDGYRPDDSTNFICYSIPIWDEDADDLLGELWVYIDSDELHEIINSYAKADNRTVYELCDRSERFMCSGDDDIFGITIYDYLYRFNPQKADHYYEYIKKTIDSGSGINSFFDGDIPYTIAMVRLPYTGFVIFSYLKSEHLQHNINSLRSICRLIYFISLLLVIACSWTAFNSYKETANETIKIDHDLAIAKSIQDSYLPQKLPECPGADLSYRYRSAKMVGGDMVDFLVKDGKIFFCIGDVTGKGVPASITMAVTCSDFRNAVRSEANAAAIASRMNLSLSEHNDTMTFCTAVIGVFDPGDGSLSYCDAGHTSPLLRKNDGQCSFVRNIIGFPLGVFDDAKYDEVRMTLEKGDMIYFYTDGVTEAKSKTKKMFGGEHLLSVVSSLDEPSSEGVISKVFEAVDSFSEGTEQSDDIAMLCLRRV